MFSLSNQALSKAPQGVLASQGDYASKQQQQPQLQQPQPQLQQQQQQQQLEEPSALQQEVLDEYLKLKKNMDNLASTIATLTAQPTSQILDSLRQLERKTGMVYTLLKASVYSIVLQQEMHDADVVGGTGMGGDMDDMLGEDR